ncbi:MAG: hypothetical protein RMJ15_05105 [Nitrososphaerota archaeon]|nr:hypothetical protein [Candidatus Bathyarchaeota archaeon]MDW8023098.1 hypothetical protein [Nitrososphaerota archaeon]
MSKSEDKPENKAQSEKPEAERKEIEKIRSDVDRLSQELRTAVDELKKSIVDIRSAVSEIENPFNLLRAVASEKDLEKLNSERLPSGVKSLFLGKPEKEEEEVKKAEEKPPEPQILEEKALALETKPERELPPPIPREHDLQSSRVAYLDWVWSLLDLGFSSDDINQLAQSYERLGFLPQGSSEQVYSLAVAAEKAKSKGLSMSKLLLNMYEASLISGMRIGIEDMKRLISIAEKGLKKSNDEKG